MTDIELGNLVRDTVTGFEGYAVTHAEHLHGCDRINVQPTEVRDDGSLGENEWFDAPRLQVIGSGIKGQIEEEREQMEKTGGPRQSSKRKEDSG